MRSSRSSTVVRFLLAGAMLLLVVLLIPRRADAQPPGAPPISVRWNNGLEVATADGANDFQIGTLIELDGRFDLDDPLHEETNTFVLRRVRPIFQGRAARYFEFRVMPDFGNGQTVLFDAYFDVRFSRTFRVRAGKDKTPIGLEQLYSDYALLLPERTLLTNLVPNRDVGVQLQGVTLGGMVSYIGGVMNGIPDATNGDIDTNSSKDLVGRLTVLPFNRTRNPALRPFGVAVGATIGEEAGPLPSYRSTAQQTFFSYAPNVVADGARTRVSPSAFYFYKSFGTVAEYAHDVEAVSGPTASASLTHTAWEVTGSYVLTGEPTSERGVIPARPFDPAQHHWGAVQVVARYSRLDLDPRAFSSALASSTSNPSAHAAGVAATLYANAYVKYVLSYERTWFEDSPQFHRPPEHALVFRLQLNLQPTL
jgi:phosphate-selective porin OprO and OprP